MSDNYIYAKPGILKDEFGEVLANRQKGISLLLFSGKRKMLQNYELIMPISDTIAFHVKSYSLTFKGRGALAFYEQHKAEQ